MKQKRRSALLADRASFPRSPSFYRQAGQWATEVATSSTHKGLSRLNRPKAAEVNMRTKTGATPEEGQDHRFVCSKREPFT